VEEVVTCAQDVLGVIQRGEGNRHISTTDYNLHSSRSHTIFQMIIESRQRSNDSTTLSTRMTPQPRSLLNPRNRKDSVKISQLVNEEMERTKRGRLTNFLHVEFDWFGWVWKGRIKSGTSKRRGLYQQKSTDSGHCDLQTDRCREKVSWNGLSSGASIDLLGIVLAIFLTGIPSWLVSYKRRSLVRQRWWWSAQSVLLSWPWMNRSTP
jgi:hypothetical protein